MWFVLSVTGLRYSVSPLTTNFIQISLVNCDCYLQCSHRQAAVKALLSMATCVIATVLRITATVDDEMTIYNEGVVVATHDNWRDSVTVIIDDPCVLAIEGERGESLIA